jgi:hypothetical protein
MCVRKRCCGFSECEADGSDSEYAWLEGHKARVSALQSYWDVQAARVRMVAACACAAASCPRPGLARAVIEDGTRQTPASV